MKTLGNILWHFPFFGFIGAILVFLLGGLLTLTVVAAPIGLGLIQYSKFLFWPFGNAMISKTDLNVQQNKYWALYSKIIMIIYFPIGLICAAIAILQVVGLFVTIIGIPSALVIAKSLGTYLNPVNKVCVPSAVKDELDKRSAENAVDKYLNNK